MSGFFDSARKEGFPTMFPPNKTAVTADVLETGFIVAFVMLILCFYLVIPGFRGNYQIFLLVRVTVSLLVGAILMTCNFGQVWEVGSINSPTAYKAGMPNEINATIGVKIGLRSVNVTLLETGNPERKHPIGRPRQKWGNYTVRYLREEDYERNNWKKLPQDRVVWQTSDCTGSITENKEHSQLPGEKINYNERFWWTWDQGRFGFGPYAGELQQSFREAQRKGLPLPILWVVDYFTIDGEGLRYGRHYRTAGWYSHIAMWSAFPCWLIANFMFSSVIRYGAYFTLLTGAFQLLACLLWAVIRNANELVIPFENGNLTTKFGPNFWVTLVSGIVCTILGFLIVFLDLRYPDNIALFFGVDPLADYEEYHLTTNEIEVLRPKGRAHENDMVEMNEPNSPSEITHAPTQCVLKRRSTVKRAQKSLYRTPSPQVRVIAHSEDDDDDEEMPIYLNVPRRGYAETIPEEMANTRNDLDNA